MNRRQLLWAGATAAVLPSLEKVAAQSGGWEPSVHQASASSAPELAKTYPTDPSQVGVPADWSAKSSPQGVFHATESSAVYEDTQFGEVYLEAENVTFRRCKFVSTTPWHLVRAFMMPSHATFEDCEFDGHGTTSNGILGGYFTMRRCYLHGFENCVGTAHFDVTIDQCYMNDLRGNPDGHFDTCELGGDNVIVTNSNLINEHGQTGVLYGAGIRSHIRFENNRLIGGGYTLYLGDSSTSFKSDVVVRNNRIKPGKFGAVTINGPLSELTWENNIDDDTGAPIGV